MPATAFNDALLLPLERSASPGHGWVLQVEAMIIALDEHCPVLAEIASYSTKYGG